MHSRFYWMLADAMSGKVAIVYLLTATAPAFFAMLGFVPCARELAHAAMLAQ